MATPRKATQRSSSATTPLTLVLNVTLRDVQPACWRGLVVDGRMTLDRLHDVIQTAFDGDSWDPKAFQVDEVNESLAMMH